MSAKYETLDRLILNSLGGAPNRFGSVACGEALVEANRLDSEDHSHPAVRKIGGDRYVDRRLQALKRAGKVKFVKGPRGGWVRGDGGGAA